ncbi:kinase-like domain-containing protein [Gigaspora rosea]|uniref:Kinase-like domain-containing protein n=1 Tax=Gigaspora rosea TaxID=44941 RepID=A0A397UIK8_9GLOM|nr:kinase-like domain-containing protein [Gigaspora rosea]
METLREYLKINSSKLEWTDKLRMAREILDGLKFLHKNIIIHRDLCSWNASYIDPQYFKSGSYKCSKKSDIFFGKADRHFNRLKKIPYDIIFHASKGEREISIEGIPNSYIQLYKRCWNYGLNQRPELEEISRKLMDLSEMKIQYI